MNRILAQIGVVAMIASLVGWQSYRLGGNHCQAAHNVALIASQQEGARINAERVKIKTERDELARKLELEANEEPVFVTQCLGPSRVRRLNSLN